MENIMEHKTKSKRKPNMSYQAKERRRRVITRLEEQLKAERKNNKYGFFPLTEKDITRIKKEIEVLKTRV